MSFYYNVKVYNDTLKCDIGNHDQNKRGPYSILSISGILL